METQKIVKILIDADNESSKFITKRFYVIHDQNGIEWNEDGTGIIFKIHSIKLRPCDYSDAYILLTGDVI